MRKPFELYVASRIQIMVQIRSRDVCFATKLHYYFCSNSFGARGVESPHGGAIEAVAGATDISNVERAKFEYYFCIYKLKCISIFIVYPNGLINRMSRFL